MQYLNVADLNNIQMISKMFKKITSNRFVIHSLRVFDINTLEMHYLLSQKYYITNLQIIWQTLPVLEKMYQNKHLLCKLKNVSIKLDSVWLHNLSNFTNNQREMFMYLLSQNESIEVELELYFYQHNIDKCFELLSSFVYMCNHAKVDTLRVRINIGFISHIHYVTKIIHAMHEWKQIKSEYEYDIYFRTPYFMDYEELLPFIHSFIRYYKITKVWSNNDIVSETFHFAL